MVSCGKQVKDHDGKIFTQTSDFEGEIIGANVGSTFDSLMGPMK